MYKTELQTKNITPWKNTRQFIILHHTATWYNTINWVLNTLTKWTVSCHYVVDTNWDKYKIWATDNILWHAWISEYWKYKDMNRYSIWIEVIWPLPWFTNEQKKSVKELVEHLMFKFNIPKENILRHKDITNRKIDIDDSFWNKEYKTFKDFKNTLTPKELI